MADTQRELKVAQTMDHVWDFVSDMGNWASQMPGYVSHETSTENDSVWTLNVDIGPFQREIVVDVHVVRWASPSQVDFEVKGRYEPFSGGGAFRAEPSGETTEIMLAFNAEPSGSMAKMITPLVGPVLERLANQFTFNLGNALGGALGTDEEASGHLMPNFLKRFTQRLIAIICKLTGRGRRS